MDTDPPVTRVTHRLLRRLAVIPACTLHASSLLAQVPDTVSVHLTDTDLRAAVQLLSQYVDRPVVIANVPTTKVTLETPHAVPRADILPLLRATLESQGLELTADSGAGPRAPYRIRQKEQQVPTPLNALQRRNAGPIQLYSIALHHARATEVAATVNALYGRASAFGELSTQMTPTLAQQLQQNQLPPAGTAPPGATPSRSATLAGETVIIPDASTNTLLIRATQPDYELVAAAVKTLDIRPLQVLIQVLIAEVRRDRALAFGVDVNLPATRLPGHPSTTYHGTQTGLGGAGDAILRVVGLGGDRDLEATLSAEASRGNVTIVSRPTVLAVNNERAEINVGSQRPFVQVSRSLPTDAPIRDQVVQYKDVGTKLSVRPTISTDGFVMLQVSQEVSAATTERQFDAPVISTRSVQTQLLLKDGQTVVLGGLTDRQNDVTQAGVPLLSSLPIIGGIFGRASHRTTETELFLFITPIVIKDDAGVDAVTKPARQRAARVR